MHSMFQITVIMLALTMGGLCAEWADPVTVPYCAGSILPTLYLEAPKNIDINRQTKHITVPN